MTDSITNIRRMIISNMLLQSCDLIFELVNDICILGNVVLNIKNISLNICFYVLGPVGVFQSVVSVLIVAAGWGYVSYHNCPAVSSQRIL